MSLKSISIIIFIIVSLLVVFFAWQNNSIIITNYNYKNTKLPKGFEGYKILQISDLHNKNFHGRLAEKVRKVNPDIIVITGDLIDRRKTNIDVAMEFVREIVNIAPVYYVTGNHEQLTTSYNELKEELIKSNVSIIDNTYVVLNNNGDEIGMLGMSDPTVIKRENHSQSKNIDYAKNTLEGLYENINTKFNILLSHRPELFPVYKEMKADLVFTGHAHGGQIRIPFVGGILSPNQGLFPKYSEGMTTEEDTTIVVSRGLGNSLFPLRIFNRPEIVVVTFVSKLI